MIFQSLAVLSIALLYASPALTIPQDSARVLQCKPMSGDPNWPSDDAWSKLNKTVSGKLLAPLPPAVVCYPDGKPVSVNASAACAAVAASWGSSTFHADNPVSVDWPIWEQDACLPTDLYDGPGASCDLKRYPKYVLDAHGPEDVQAGVNFAVKTGVRLVVKATGHDFLGRSTAPGSLSIWTHNIKSQSYSPSFQPENCGSSSLAGKPALTIAAGHQMRDVYAFAKTYNVTPVAGADPNVGIAGWMLGGGHSTISAKYGLGVDNVVEMKIVTPTGDYVTANECQNADLFWAFRGGGGSTFGVMISVTTLAHPDAPFTVGYLYFNSTWSEANNNNNNNFFEMLTYVYQQLPMISDAGMGGYTATGKIERNATENPYSASAPENNVPTLTYVNDPAPKQMYFSFEAGALDKTPADLAPVVQPILDKFAQYNGSLQGEYSLTPDPAFSLYRDSIPPGGVGVNTLIGSRLWDKAALAAPGLTEDLRVLTNPGLQGLLVSGPAVRAGSPDAVSANPAWRRTYLHLITALATDWRDPQNLAASKDHLKNVWEPILERRSPGMGSYVNENNPFQTDWQRKFWGANYPRLLAIKKKVDPKGLFWCPVCVGGEDWREDGDGKVCRA